MVRLLWVRKISRIGQHNGENNQSGPSFITALRITHYHTSHYDEKAQAIFGLWKDHIPGFSAVSGYEISHSNVFVSGQMGHSSIAADFYLPAYNFCKVVKDDHCLI